MKIKLSVLFVTLLLLSGCVGIKDGSGWSSSTKSEFLDILKNDDYASICNKTELYKKVKDNEDSKMMTSLLISYSKNLANGCINMGSFRASQASKRHRGIDTKYVTYPQKVNTKNIVLKLKAGKTIKEILAPYTPTYRQFFALIKVYQGLDDKSSVTAKKVRVSIERVKLLKPHLGKTYALVNIPEFKVRIIENGKNSLEMKVITGKTNKQTPIFSATLSYINLNPQWSVPDSIARNEIIPRLIRDKGYAARRNMAICAGGYNLNGKKLDPRKLDLKKYVGGKGYVPFKFVQRPSSRNALGRVKFIFPNPYSVYMHDTGNKGLFNRKVRAFSHGCIRLSQPQNMLKHISGKYSTKSYASVQKWYKSRKTTHINLSRKLPVHTAYLTAYVNEAGELLTFNDIYGYDKSQRLNF